MPTINYHVDTETGTVTATGVANVEMETFQDSDSDCGNLDTPDAGDLNTAARECATRRGWAMEGGRYPIRSKEMHGEADLKKAIRAVGRGGGSHDAIRRHIMKRARSLGLSDQIPDEWTRSGDSPGTESGTDPVTFQDDDDNGAECPEGQVKDVDGNCVDSDDREPQEEEPGRRRTSPRRYSLDEVMTADGAARPSASVFTNPNLNRATPLTVDEDGRVFGHLATWDECHLGIGNRCVTAPHSATSYAYFLTGEVFCDDGSKLPVGKITLGTGHADPALGHIPAAEHYDNSGSVVAVVNAGEDQFGIWVAGTLVPGVDEQRLAELRRSPLSGDWRRIGGNLELVAALAVVSGGFPVLRASAEGDETLIAAGVVTEPGDLDQSVQRASRWKKIEDVVRSERVKKLLGE